MRVVMDKTEISRLERERERSFLFESAIYRFCAPSCSSSFDKKASHTRHTQTKKKKKMEVEEEHEVLRAVRRNAERLSSSSSNNNDDDNNKDNAEAISSCLRSLRAHFCRGQGKKKKTNEVSAKDCLRVRGGFVFL